MGDVNIVTVILIGLFALPVLAGALSPFSSTRLQRSLGSLLNSVIFLASAVAAIRLTGLLLSDDCSPYLKDIFRGIPSLCSPSGKP